MLVIKNYKKIRNQYFGDWQIGKMQEMNDCYALQAFSTIEQKSITMVILREPIVNEAEWDTAYQISLVEDNGNSNIIEDIIYHSVLEDMDMFGESLIHYLNTL